MDSTRQPYDSDLTDAQWGLIQDLATLPRRTTGRKRVNPRESFNARLYVLSTGCRWNDLPHDFGISDTSAYRYLSELKRRKRLGSDKGFDSDRLRQEMRRRRIVPCFSVRGNHTPKLTNRERSEQKYCRKRWRIERTFAWINMNRRIDRMLERKIKSYEMFMDLACIRHYLRLVTKRVLK